MLGVYAVKTRPPPSLPPSLPPVMTAAEKSHAEKIITLEITRSPNNITRIGPRLSNVHLSHLPRGGRREEERGEREGERGRKGEREGGVFYKTLSCIN